MAQRSSPILPLTRGIGAVSPVNVGGPGSAEEAFRNEQGILQRLFSGLGGGGNRTPSLSDISGGYYIDQRGAGSAVPAQPSPMLGMPDESSGLGVLGEDPTMLPFGIDRAVGALGSLFQAGSAAQPQRIIGQPDDLIEVNPRFGTDFPDPRGSMGGSLFGDPVETTPAQAQETAGILTKLIEDSATRGGAEKESSTTVQGDVTDITEQFDDTVETNPLFGAETAPRTRSFGPDPDEEATKRKKSSLYAGLLKESLDNYNTLVDNAPSGAKTMEEYKKEFSDATGIDITGQPDNSAALTAFGLALMQNKAGKGFDVGALLSETGRAGEKALPLMAQARKEAREAQIAAGQYALGATKEDRAARAKSLDEATKYLVGRRDTILDQERARIEAIEDFDKQTQANRDLEILKAGFDSQIEIQKLLAKANEPNFKVGNVKDWQPLDNKKNVILSIGLKEKDGRPVFLYPAEQATTLGEALADVVDGLNGMDSLRDKIIEASRTPAGRFAGISGQKAYEVYEGWAASLGYDGAKVPQFDDEGNYTGTKRERPIAEADAIRERVIAQFKRFLTQETGNGISNVDIQKIDNLLGKIDFLTDPQDALNRIEEVREIFLKAESKLTSTIQMMDNKDRYQTPEEYNLARKAISDGINRAYYKQGTIGGGGAGDRFAFTVDADGNQVYDFTQ